MRRWMLVLVLVGCSDTGERARPRPPEDYRGAVVESIDEHFSSFTITFKDGRQLNLSSNKAVRREDRGIRRDP